MHLRVRGKTFPTHICRIEELTEIFQDDDLKDCVFDFQSFEADSDSEDTILDHSGLAISKLVEDSYTTAYLTGEFRIRSKVDSSIQVCLMTTIFT